MLALPLSYRAELQLLVPPGYQARDHPLLPASGGALWGETFVAAWKEPDEGPKSPADSAATLALWLASRDGYPTVGAPARTEMASWVECQQDLDGRFLRVAAFELLYPDGMHRYFAVGVWPLATGYWLKAMHHGASERSRREAREALRSARLRNVL